MQAVVLAAGKGTRMHPLTLTKPKQLVEVAGKPILEHIINTLPDAISEVIVVVGYKGDMILNFCGDQYCGKKMRYVWQHDALGTAHALEQARDLLKDSFLLVYGDDIVDKESMSCAIKKKSCVLAYEHENPCAFGVIETNGDGTVKTIVEKPEKPATNLVSASGLVLHTDIFKYYGDWPKQGEMYVTHALNRYAKENPVHVQKLKFWYPINSLEQLRFAEKELF